MSGAVLGVEKERKPKPASRVARRGGTPPVVQWEEGARACLLGALFVSAC